MNLAQNVCLDDFKVMYSFLSSDSLKFFHLGQFLSNYWSYRVIFGTCELISRSSLKLGHLGTKTRSPGQTSRKPCLHSSSHIFEAIIINLAQNVCLDEF